MFGYRLIRLAVDGLEDATQAAFRAMRSALDWAESRQAKPGAKAEASPQHAEASSPNPPVADDIDEDELESFPASDPPAHWAGPAD